MKRNPKFIAAKVAVSAIYPILLSDDKIENAVKKFVNDYPYFENIESEILATSLRLIRLQRDFV